MSQEVVSVLVSAGGVIVAAAIIGAVRGIFKVAKAIRDNTSTLADLSKTMTDYIHTNDTRSAVTEGKVHNLENWRLTTEASNQAAALGTGKNGVP